jgi:hypothetical protein
MMTSLLLLEWKRFVGSIKNENENDNENENVCGASHSVDIRVRRGYNKGPQKGTVTGFHILW